VRAEIAALQVDPSGTKGGDDRSQIFCALSGASDQEHAD
jgi:hypothetical protein